MVFLDELFEFPAVCGYVHLRCGGKQDSFRLRQNRPRFIRVYHFYCDQFKSIKQILSADEIEIKITKGRKSSYGLLASGSFRYFGAFPDRDLHSARTETRHVYLFKKTAAIGSIGVILGVEYTGLVSGREVEDRVCEYNGVYIGRDSCITPQVLPDSWIDSLGSEKKTGLKALLSTTRLGKSGKETSSLLSKSTALLARAPKSTGRRSTFVHKRMQDSYRLKD